MLVPVMVVVGGHEQVLLVFVRRGVRGLWLHRLSESSKVKFVRISFTVHLCHDVFVVVIPQGAGELVVIHVGFALPFTPSSRHFVRVDQLEFPVCPFPCDVVGVGSV